MEGEFFRLPLHLPAQGAAETEATIIEWHVAEGDRFEKGQVLAQIDGQVGLRFPRAVPRAGDPVASRGERNRSF